MAEGNPRGGLAARGAGLVSNGYWTIPITRGEKYPKGEDGKGWEQFRWTKADQEEWLKRHPRDGVGILTVNTPAADLDIRDQAAVEHMREFVRWTCGDSPRRIGFAPKELLLYRTDTPFRKKTSHVWIDDWEQENKVEILCDGQQFVAYHIHPDTGKPYVWHEGSPISVKQKELPTMSEADAEAIVAEFNSYAEKQGWRIKRKAHKPKYELEKKSSNGLVVATDDVFASDKPKARISLEELETKLMLVPDPDDYEQWTNVGMALWHQFDGEEEGLILWHKWSALSEDKYDYDACEAKWPTFDHRDSNAEPLTARFIIEQAKRREKEIAVEAFRELQAEIGAAASIDAIHAVCDKIKKIEFQLLQRAQLVNMIKGRFKTVTGDTIPIGTVREMTRYEFPDVRDRLPFMQEFVYVTHDRVFYNPKTREAMKAEAFDAKYDRFMLTQKDRLEGRGRPELHASEYALNVVEIETVHLRMYLPGEDHRFRFNGQLCINTYRDADLPDEPSEYSSADKRAIAIVQGHAAHLFPDPIDQAIILDVCAWITQNPGKHLNFAVLMQGVEGDGKTFFARLLGYINGGTNVRVIQALQLDEKYNSWAEGSQVVFFEEIRLTGHRSGEILDKMKLIITAEMVPIRRMNTDVYDSINVTTYFLTTNFPDALPITNNDSRYAILISRWQDKAELNRFEAENPTYYKDLHAAIEEHAGALRRYFLERPVEAFDPTKRAPATRGKLRMIENTKSDEVANAEYVLTNSCDPDLSFELVNSKKLAEQFGEMGFDYPHSPWAVRNMMQRLGLSPIGRLKLGKEVVQFYAKRPEMFVNIEGKVERQRVIDHIEASL